MLPATLRCRTCSESLEDARYPKCPQCRRDHETLINLASRRYGVDDELQIDPDARLSRGEDGVWVQAWVFLSHDDIP